MRALSKAASLFASGINWISRQLARVCEGLLFLMMATVCYDVAMRYFLHKPTFWSVEVNSFMLVFLGFIPAAEILRQRRHIRLDLVFNRLNRRAQGLTEIIISLLGLFFCAIIVWQMSIFTSDAYHYWFRASSILATPLFIPYSFLIVGMGLLGLQYLIKLVEDIRHFILGKGS